MDWLKPKMSASLLSDLLIAYTVSGNLDDESDTMALKVAVGPGYYGDTGDKRFIRITQIMIRATAVRRLVHAMIKPQRQAEAVWSGYLGVMEKWADGVLAKMLNDWLMGFEAVLMSSDLDAHGISALSGVQRKTEEDGWRMISCMGKHYAKIASGHSDESAEALAKEGEKIFLDSISAIHTMIEKAIAKYKIV